jgi:hypothetical protein
MQTIIESSRLSRGEVLALSNGERIATRAGQAVVWVSITPPTTISLPSNWPRFPAILDTGFNGTFLIGERELRDWGGIAAGQLAMIPPTRIGWPRIGPRVIPPYDATVWIHPQLDKFAEPLEPFAVYPDRGILVPPSEAPLTRLPLIGTRLLEVCGLQVTFDPVLVEPALSRFEMRFSVRSMLK